MYETKLGVTTETTADVHARQCKTHIGHRGQLGGDNELDGAAKQSTPVTRDTIRNCAKMA